MCAAAPRGRGSSGYFKILFLSFNLCVLFFQKATKFLGQIVVKLFGHNYLRKGSVRYYFWPKGVEKNRCVNKGLVNQESLENADLEP